MLVPNRKIFAVLTVPVLAITLTLSACSGSGGSNSVNVKLADILPSNHFITTGFTQPFIDRAEQIAKSGGHDLSIKLYPEEQLGKAADQVSGLKSGIFEMANVAPPYNGDTMPLGNVFDLPRMADQPGTLAKAYYDVSTDPSSVIYKTDYKRNGIRSLANYALPLYQFATVDRPISDVNALHGLKIRSGGGAQDQVVEALGGSPVHLTTPEEYEGLQRHTIDAGTFNLPSLISNKTYEVTKYFTTNANVSSFVGGVAISDDAWDRLPSWAQEALTKAGAYATTKFADDEPALEKQTIQSLTSSKYGLKATTFSAGDLRELDKLLQPAIQSWVHDVTSQGYDGAAALENARAAIEKASHDG